MIFQTRSCKLSQPGLNVMLVIGIDPGLAASGIVVLDDQIEVKFALTLYTRPGALSDRLNYIYGEFSQILSEWKPDIGVLESTIYHKNVRTALNLGAVRGVFLVTMAQHGVPVMEISPTRVKLGLTGQGRARKNQVAYMVQRLVHVDKELTEHEYDAAGLCLACLKDIGNAIRLRR